MSTQSYQKDEYVEHNAESHWSPGESFSSVYSNISDHLYIKTVFFIASFCVLLSF